MNKATVVLDDSILVGILHAKGHDVQPTVDDRLMVHFHISGDVERSLREIYANEPVGSLDVLNSIKACRSMIFNLKGGRR